MTISEQLGKVQTVLGTVDAEDLGITLAHDHVLVDVSIMFVEPEDESQKELAHQKISLQNRGWIGYNWTSNRDNVELTEMDVAIAELKRFVDVGGRSIVDPTNVGLGREPEALAKIARETGMNIVMGAGYYLGNTHPADMSSRGQDSIAREIIADIQLGIGDQQIRAGLIGEIGCTYPWLPNEKKSLHAAVDAQLETGAALMVHPGRDPLIGNGLKILRKPVATWSTIYLAMRVRFIRLTPRWICLRMRNEWIPFYGTLTRASKNKCCCLMTSRLSTACMHMADSAMII